jgi:RNA polymerase sigma factor (sigma-70 family)
LLQIADRVARGSFRRANRETTIGDEVWALAEPLSNVDDPAAKAVSRETNQQLDAALKQLSDVQRRALLLRYFGHLTFEQIAETLDCPLNTALSHCHRGLQMLRKHFERDAP